MPRNIEIKARIDSVETFALRIAAIADNGPVEILQDDTFFRCDGGRLKLRTLGCGAGELIFYRRQVGHGPKESYFLRSRVAEPQRMIEVLSASYGIVGQVKKIRQLFTLGRSRIHLDRVKDLGDFIEIEVALDDDELFDVGVQDAEQLMARLGVMASQLVDAAYVDLLPMIQVPPI
jgi:predicted adenylyl cyclase CyaB